MGDPVFVVVVVMCIGSVMLGSAISFRCPPGATSVTRLLCMFV